MAFKDLREWIAKIEEVGELQRIKAEVNWDIELYAITRRVMDQEGPALLFENIKDHQNTVCRKLFTNGSGSRARVAMALDLPRETGYRKIVEVVKERLGKQIAPVIESSGPVKQNIVKGDAINLYEFPVPKFCPLDGGRYINTTALTITMDPDTKIMNVGMYRGMLGKDGKSIPVLLVGGRHWGRHFHKYKERGEEMPVAVVYGTDPALLYYASTPIVHPHCSEWDLLGGLRGEAVELVKCETSDLYVPASAEIVVEGRISPDPATFQMEGPFGEYPGFYGGLAQRRPVIRVECVTHRDDPIFRGGAGGSSPGHFNEPIWWIAATRAAGTWKLLEDAGVPGILGVWGPPVTALTNLRVQINAAYRGHAKQVAAALWGAGANLSLGKNLIVVDKDIDIFDDQAVEWAVAYRTNAGMGAFQFFDGPSGTVLDPSVPLWQRNHMKYGTGRWTWVLIDATVNWDLEPEEQYGGKREPPLCTVFPDEVNDAIGKRWHEYGF
ncbi:UbiD family decarboxylase [Chloroflexota bacterium]